MPAPLGPVIGRSDRTSYRDPVQQGKTWTDAFFLSSSLLLLIRPHRLLHLVFRHVARLEQCLDRGQLADQDRPKSVARTYLSRNEHDLKTEFCKIFKPLSNISLVDNLPNKHHPCELTCSASRRRAFINLKSRYKNLNVIFYSLKMYQIRFFVLERLNDLFVILCLCGEP